MSRSLDISGLRSFKTTGINMPQEDIEKALEEVGIDPSEFRANHEAKKKAQEQALEKKVKSLEKIEKKTDKLLKKAQKRRDTVETHVEPVKNPVVTREPLPRPAPSITDYHMLNRNPKKVMKFIMSAFSASGSSEKTVFINTYELKDETGLSAESIRQVFIILKKNGYIEVERSRSNGMRMVTINDSLFQ